MTDRRETLKIRARGASRTNIGKDSDMIVVTAVLMSLLTATTSVHQEKEFHWKHVIASGRSLEVIGINGSIDVTGGGSEAEVTAVKKGRKSDPDEVEIRVVEHSDGVTICAVYPSRGGRTNECKPGGGHSDTRNNDVQVHFTVRVPAGVRFVGHTVNGDLSAVGLDARAKASTVNGSVTLETTDQGEASTVNGSIHAKIGKTDWSGDLDYSTVNGGITIELPQTASLSLDASTVNGSISTDFPLTIQGRFGPRKMHGTIGQGGRGLRVETVNGSVTLKRRA